MFVPHREYIYRHPGPVIRLALHVYLHWIGEDMEGYYVSRNWHEGAGGTAENRKMHFRIPVTDQYLKHWPPYKKQGMLIIWSRQSLCHFDAFVSFLPFRCPLRPVSISRRRCTRKSQLQTIKTRWSTSSGCLIKLWPVWVHFLCIHRLSFPLIILLMSLSCFLFTSPLLVTLVRK
jgi:hypothetical protein